jgi:hypothetical protein
MPHFVWRVSPECVAVTMSAQCQLVSSLVVSQVSTFLSDPIGLNHPSGSANHKEMYDELEELGSQLDVVTTCDGITGDVMTGVLKHDVRFGWPKQRTGSIEP